MDSCVLDRILKCIQRVKDLPKLDYMEYLEYPLTGKDMGFTSQEMVYVLLEISDEFAITFESKDVINYGFNSIRKIVEIVHQKLFQTNDET